MFGVFRERRGGFGHDIAPKNAAIEAQLRDTERVIVDLAARINPPEICNDLICCIIITPCYAMRFFLHVFINRETFLIHGNGPALPR